MDLSVRTDRTTFVLEITMVSVASLTAAVHTIQSWASPVAPIIWGSAAFVVFLVYRAARYLRQGDRSERGRADDGESATEAERPHENDESSAEDAPSGDETDEELRVPATNEYDGAGSDESTAYLDWEEAKKAGLISTMPDEQESAGKAEESTGEEATSTN